VRSSTRLFLLWWFIHPLTWAQLPVCAVPYDNGEKPPKASSVLTFQGATRTREALLRREIQIMQPRVIPLRIIFLPHRKYLYTAKVFQLHVPRGMSSLMFTHLPSRSVFIDEDRVGSDEALVYWMAHELGHLATNSAKEEDAERAARQFRSHLTRSSR
jgi:hypothetical protein